MTEALGIEQGPPKAAELDELVASIVEIGFCRSPSFSPEGDQVAFVSDQSGMPQLWIVPTAGGTPARVSNFADPVERVLWSPAGEWLALTVAPRGMNTQLYVMRPDGTALRRLTDGKSENNFLGVWTPDGRALTMSSNRRMFSAGDAYLVDVASGKQRRVTKSPGLGGFIDVTRDGKYALLYRLIHRGNDNLFLVDLAARREVLLTPHDGPGSFNGKFSADGRIVYLQSNKDRDRMAFAKVEIGKNNQPGEIELLAARDDAVLEHFALDHQGTLAALVWNIAGRSELELFDLATNQLKPAPATLPAEVVGGLSFSPDGRLLLMSAQGAAAPSAIWTLNLLTGDCQQLTATAHPGIDFDKLIHPQLARFVAHDGIELSGWLYRPRCHTSPGPIVLSLHGGPEAQERPDFNATYQSLLTKGISVFAPNIRGSAGFGKTFVNLDNGPLRFNVIKDVKTCVDYVVENGIADPRCIGIMGASYGGYLVLAGLTEFPDRFAAGADISGIVNFESFLANTQPWMAVISKIKYGNPKTDLEMLRRLSPIHKLERLIAPTIILHGANDTNVPVSEAEQVVESLKRRGVPFEYIVFPDEGHGLAKTSNRIRATIAVVNWFAEHLKEQGPSVGSPRGC
jgi:dipeptidyl aminopeptidase/acylaminoacyl peptidase